MTQESQPSQGDNVQPDASGGETNAGPSTDGGSTAEAGGSEGGGDDATAQLKAATEKIAALEAKNNALLADVKALKKGKAEATGKAQTAEERLAALEKRAEEAEAREAEASKTVRRSEAMTAILEGVPAANTTTVRRLAAALEAEGKFDLAAEDRDAAVKTARSLLEKEHGSLLKAPEQRPDLPTLPAISNDATGQRGAPVLRADGKQLM